jgi:hypothetical protein
MNDLGMGFIPVELLTIIPGKPDSREDFRIRVEYNLAKIVEAYKACMYIQEMNQSKKNEILDLLKRIPFDVLSLPKVQATIVTFNALLLVSLDSSK